MAVFFLIFLPLALLLFSAIPWVMLFIGWWGRPVRIPASCARCSHETGDAPSLLLDACPECGAPLDRPGAIVWFRRERTPMMKMLLGVAAVLLVLGVLGFPAFLLFASVRNVAPVGLNATATPAPVAESSGSDGAESGGGEPVEEFHHFDEPIVDGVKAP
jgi:hypothetical protein